MDQLPRLGKRKLICLLSFTCNYVVFVWRGFLFLWVLGMGYVILLWHSLSLPYNYITTGSYLFPRFKRSGAQVLQQVRISFPASTDLELKYYNRFISLSPLQHICSSSITTGSYLFPSFIRSGAELLQQVRISFPASTDLELKYYNRLVSLSLLQQIWSSSITTGSYLFPRFNRYGAQV